MQDLLEQAKASFAAMTRIVADQQNALALDNYIIACRNAAENAIQTGAPPVALVVPRVVVAVNEYPAMKLVETDLPVSTLKPHSFMPQKPLEVGAVGGPIGGPIPGSPGMFYALSSATPGEQYRTNGATYVYRRPTPFGGYWEAQ